jgi:ankyrin repeat protein
MANFQSIMDAFEANDFDKFKTLTSKIKNINSVNDDEMTIFGELCVLASFDKTAKEVKPYIDHLLGLGAHINTLDSMDRSPLSCVAKEGNLDLVKLLIKSGADVNFTSDEGWGPVYQAMRADQVVVVRYLLGVKSFDKSKKAGDMSLGKFAKNVKSKQCISLLKELDIK